MAIHDLTAQRVRELLDYDSTTGYFYWRNRASQRRPSGSIAGYTDPRGYRRIKIDKMYLCMSHRLAWLYVHGQWPTKEIDHINGNTSDNRIENLREVDHMINSQNQRSAMSHSSHGFLGVTRARKRWKAHIKWDGKQMTLGYFDSPEEAHAVYITAKRLLHPGCTL